MTTNACYNYFKFEIDFYSKNFEENKLFQAIVNNNMGLLREQIDNGVNINCIGDLEIPWTPLLTAMALNRKEAVQILLESGVSTELSLMKKGGVDSVRTSINAYLFDLVEKYGKNINELTE